MILCITPNPALDHTLTVSELRAGSVMRATSSRLTAGGKGINVARAVRTLGGEALCMGLVGGPSGQHLETLARAEGLRFEWTRIDGNTRTCVIAVSNDGDSTVINEEGPQVTALDWSNFRADVLRSLSLSPAIISFSGSLPKASPLDAWEQLLRTAQSAKQPVWVDTSGKPLETALRVGGLNLKINSAEMSDLLKRPVEDAESAIEAARELRKTRLSSIVVTLGKGGAVLVDSSGAIQSCAPEVETVNAVGSGDAFLGGLLVALSRDLPPREALSWGIAAGAANAMSSGGAHFTFEQFQKFKSSAI